MDSVLTQKVYIITTTSTFRKKKNSIFNIDPKISILFLNNTGYRLLGPAKKLSVWSHWDTPQFFVLINFQSGTYVVDRILSY